MHSEDSQHDLADNKPWTLFIPTRFYESSDPGIQLHYTLESGHITLEFPFPDPPCFEEDFRELRFKKLYPAPLRVVSNAAKDISRRIQDMRFDTRLRNLYTSESLINNLIKYTGITEVGLPSPTPDFALADGTRLSHINAEVMAILGNIHQIPGLETPDKIQQVKAVMAVNGWYTMHLNSPSSVVVNSEFAVHDQFYKQCLSLIDLILLSRYKNRIWDTQSEGQIWPSTDNPADDKIPPGPPSGRAKNGAILELKFCTFTDAEFMEIFGKKMYTRGGDGLFDWISTTTTANAIKQVWGELNFQNSDFGAFSNGNYAFFCIKTADDELITSAPIELQHKNFFLCMIGLTLASIDAIYAREDEIGIELIDWLCPPASRRKKTWEVDIHQAW
ncbi:hypothetical protein EIP86_002820 [Pleurotus ostreatoroseus]|nr:hypothetical protein EIP86_002820 [Pleurotus ostreatoroseus]